MAFVRIAFEEISPKNLRGYGAFPEELTLEIDGLSTEVLGMVDRLTSFLRETGEESLKARMEGIASGLPIGEALTALAATIESEGLVELRPTLLSIVDRLTDTQFEVAVFGQASTGKSSLLNHILGADLLPVGVNPITAVPTRIRFGTMPELTISYAGRSVEKAPIARLAEFATEQGNPSNAKGVVRLEMTYPAPRLQSGVVLVDTPGLGSLATSGARETLAYLPRCDYGVLLVNASSTIDPEDIRTLMALKLAHIPCQVLLSKADLLSPLERTSASGYIRETLRKELGIDVEVGFVSIAGQEEHLALDWFGNSLEPLFSQRQELAMESISRKVSALQRAVEASVRARSGPAQAVAPERAKELDSVELNLRRAAGRFSEVEKECFRLCDEIRALAPAAIEPAAKRVVEYWSTSGSPAPDSIVADAVRETVSLSTNQVQRAFLDLSSELAAALADAAQALQVHNPQIQDDLLRAVREMPLFELSWPDSIEQPWFGSLGRTLSLGAARRILLTRLRSPLDAALTSYAKVVEPWCRDTLKDLQRRFDAQADPYRVQLSRPRNVSGPVR